MNRVVLAALACGAVLTGCRAGNTASPAAAPTTTTPTEHVESTRTASLEAFCGRLSDTTRATAEVGVVTNLIQVRGRLARATSLAGEAIAGGTPPGSGTFATLLAADHDLIAVNAWVQHRASQKDLDHNRQPAGVRDSFTDMGVRFRQLEDWSAEHCQAYGAGGD